MIFLGGNDNTQTDGIFGFIILLSKLLFLVVVVVFFCCCFLFFYKGKMTYTLTNIKHLKYVLRYIYEIV